jgi:hypothetical protein
MANFVQNYLQREPYNINITYEIYTRNNIQILISCSDENDVALLELKTVFHWNTRVCFSVHNLSTTKDQFKSLRAVCKLVTLKYPVTLGFFLVFITSDTSISCSA